ncbi:hypothetical protein AgCh_027956 [Apium graveolens]
MRVGSTNGIGKGTARVIALRGVHVVMAVRNVAAGGKLKEEILQKTPNARIDVMEIDLNSMDSVWKFASAYIFRGLPLNILINNVGIIPAAKFTFSKDNIEQVFAVNHLGQFLLTNLLLDTMKKTARESQIEGRIINLSSDLHKRGVDKEGIVFDEINDEKRRTDPIDYPTLLSPGIRSPTDYNCGPSNNMDDSVEVVWMRFCGDSRNM